MPVVGKVLINTLNQYSFCIAQKDSNFKKALQKSDILLPYGIAIVAAGGLLNNQKIKKIAGVDLHQYLLIELNKKSGNAFIWAHQKTQLLKIKEQISREFPDIKV